MRVMYIRLASNWMDAVRVLANELIWLAFLSIDIELVEHIYQFAVSSIDLAREPRPPKDVQ